MLYNFLNDYWFFLPLVFVFTFIMNYIFTNIFIKILKKHTKFQPIRGEMNENHQKKAKTPTMGGLPFTLSIILNILLFASLNNAYILIFLFVIIGFSAIGLADDIMKVFFNNTKGFSGSYKLIIQLLIAGIALLYLGFTNDLEQFNTVLIPFTNYQWNLGIFFMPLAVLALAGLSNAANITDGLDGLLSISVVIILSFFIVIAYFLKLDILTNISYLSIINLDNIILIMFIFMASLLSFFVFNKYPAKIFMGDVGSLMLGAALVMFSLFLKIELFYCIMAILFLIEIGSSIIQVFYFKISHGKRLFKMAPFHHHLELCGWSERKVVWGMWIFLFFCCLKSTLFLFIK